ncbi:hypothetical protein CPB86DRAFT_708476, partial [Serendipita vermifera]
KHRFDHRDVTCCHWLTAILCCPCYMPLALYRVGGYSLPCKSCNNVEETDDNGNPRCSKCGLSVEEATNLREYDQARGNLQMNAPKYGGTQQ